MVEQEYKALVLNLLCKCQYPVLRDFVVVDIWYKMIPPVDRIVSEDSVKTFDRRYANPLDVWKSNMNPFSLSYLSGGGSSAPPSTFYLCECDELDTRSLPLQCRRIKLSRSVVDRTVEYHASDSFEEELCLFWGLLNFDLPRVAPLFDMDEFSSTRCLPQFITLWAYRYDAVPFGPCGAASMTAETISRFGPPTTVGESGVLPVRVVRGRLAPCTSSETLLSLNNDVDGIFHPATAADSNVAAAAVKAPYTIHYVEKSHAFIPLAYNPLENPIIAVV